MKLPLRLLEEDLVVLDAENKFVCQGESLADLDELVTARNFTRVLHVPSMKGRAALSLEEGMHLSVIPEDHFGPGPVGLVR